MSSENPSASFRYQTLLSSLSKLSGDESLKKRLSEALTLLDFNSTLNGTLELSAVLDLVLLVSMGETQAAWAAILLADSDGVLRPEHRKGSMDSGVDWDTLAFDVLGSAATERVWLASDSKMPDSLMPIIDETGCALVAPLKNAERLVGLLLLGPSRRELEATDAEFMSMLVVSAAASIDNGRMVAQLATANRALSLKVYQLNSLFDISHELNRPQERRRLTESLVTNAMGRYLTTRAVLVDGESFVARGVKPDREERGRLMELSRSLASATEPQTASELGVDGASVTAMGFELVVPVRANETSAVLFLGPRAGGENPSRDDRDFLRVLASQAASAFDNLHLADARIEAKKVEKEMAIAHEIQKGLLPDRDPELDGWDISGINIPCLSVGGDYYDYIARPDGTLWFVIADVSGKGTGPALLMASFQASLRALSSIGQMSLPELGSRLNELIFRSTEANKYVTSVLGALDPASGQLEFVNAGHCYPLLLRAGGDIERLQEGGPVIGLFSDVPMVSGHLTLASGDLLVLYTDGLSETSNPEGHEFEEERILEMLRKHRDKSARELLARLVSGVRVFAAEAGLADDLTLMVIKRS